MHQVFGSDNHYIQDEGCGNEILLWPLACKFWWEQ